MSQPRWNSAGDLGIRHQGFQVIEEIYVYARLMIRRMTSNTTAPMTQPKNDRSDYAVTGGEPERAGKKSTNNRADDTDDDIDDQSEPSTFYDLPSYPTSDSWITSQTMIPYSIGFLPCFSSTR